jgi:hypothetical protein
MTVTKKKSPLVDAGGALVVLMLHAVAAVVSQYPPASRAAAEELAGTMEIPCGEAANGSA